MFSRVQRAFFILPMTVLMLSGCAGKYLVKTYPAGAKVYTQDIETKDKKLIGLSPVRITEESQLGDVFFLVLEKENYKTKSVMVRVNPGESLAISTQLDPKTSEEIEASKNLAQGENEDNQDQPPSSPPPDDKKDDKESLAKMEELKEEMADLNLRVALLENTTSFYKDAMFSSRFDGNGSAAFDRDQNNNVIELMFQAQQAIRSNQLEKATNYVDQAIASDAYVTNAWLLKGSISYLQKNYENAKKAWERSLKLDPYNKMALRYLNGVYKKLGQRELLKKPGKLRQPAALRELESKKRVRLR